MTVHVKYNDERKTKLTFNKKTITTATANVPISC